MGAEGHVFILEIEQDTLAQLTTRGGHQYPVPIWSPDGAQVTFASNGDNALGLHWMSSDFSDDEAHVLLSSENLVFPNAWVEDGRSLVFRETHPEAQRNILVLPIGDDGTPGTPVPFADTSFNETTAAVSPNGRWLHPNVLPGHRGSI